MGRKLLSKDPGNIPADVIALAAVRQWGRTIGQITMDDEINLIMARSLLQVLIVIRRTIAASGEISARELIKLSRACVAISRQLTKIQHSLGGSARPRRRTPADFETLLARAEKRIGRRRAAESKS